jgi:hypothetical protein
MPPWPEPCPLYVTVTAEPPSGETSFSFGAQGGVLGQKMKIRGPLERLLSSVLPHEVTHTVFAYYFRCPVPRWADEGGSVLSEDDVERDRHDKLVRGILNRGRQFQLRNLFSLRDYPPNGEQVMCLYAQGFSISDYLVKRGNRQTFLQFVAHGMQRGWDSAARTFYQHNSVEELEEAWLKHLRDTRRQPPTLVAQNKDQPPAGAAAGTLVRLTAPPAQPLPPPPVYRGASPGPEQVGQTFGGPPPAQPVGRPGFLPEPSGPGQQYVPVPVRLGPPQFVSPPSLGPPMPGNVSPVGFPR